MYNTGIKLPWISNYKCHSIIFASKLAICTGHNQYESPDDLIEEFRSKKKNINYKSRHEKGEVLLKSFLKENNIESALDAVCNNNPEESITLVKEIENIKFEQKESIKEELNGDSKFSNIVTRALIDATDFEDKELIKEYAIKKVSTEYGIKNESMVRDIINHKKGTTYVESKSFCVSAEPIITISNHKIFLGGRHDGIDDNNNLIEIKNRVKGFRNTIPLYELVQLHAYMYIFDIKQATLIENYKNKQKEHIIDFDDTLWNDIKVNLTIFMEEILNL